MLTNQLTPLPEPDTIALVLTGIGVAITCRWRTRLGSPGRPRGAIGSHDASTAGEAHLGCADARGANYCTTLLLPSVEPPIGAPSGIGRPAVGTPSR
ncbi:MAG: PEP-CTERM sorting domain-containing protein [Planctomycetia bacterium]